MERWNELQSLSGGGEKEKLFLPPSCVVLNTDISARSLVTILNDLPLLLCKKQFPTII